MRPRFRPWALFFVHNHRSYLHRPQSTTYQPSKGSIDALSATVAKLTKTAPATAAKKTAAKAAPATKAAAKTPAKKAPAAKAARKSAA